MARNRVIGAKNALPWRMPSDLKRFRAVTMGKPVVLGRRTWESLPTRPLKGRANLVVSRDRAFRAPASWAFSDLDAAVAMALAMARRSGVDEACVIGGAAIYAALLAQADRIYLSEIDLEPDGDALLPELGADWLEVSRVHVPAGANDDASFNAVVMERRC